VPLTFETADDDEEEGDKYSRQTPEPAAFQAALLGKTPAEIRAAWKEHRGDKSDVYRRRVENTSWRLFAVRHQGPEEVARLRRRAQVLKDLPPISSFSSAETRAAAPAKRQTRGFSRAQTVLGLNRMLVGGQAGEGRFAQAIPGVPRSTTPFPSPMGSAWHGAAGADGRDASSPSTSAPSGGAASSLGGRFGKGSIKHEYSDYGTGDFRPPSFRLGYADGSTTSPLHYVRHVITPGRLPMDDPCMPHVRVAGRPAGPTGPADSHAGAATTLVVTLQDRHTGFEVDLIYTVLHRHDAIVRSTRFRNSSRPGKGDGEDGVVSLSRGMSMSLDLECEAGGYYLTHLAGSWARERHVKTIKLQQGCFSFGSTRGTSSHAHNPFVVLTRGQEPAEETGMTFGFGLVYSGNHVIEAHQNEVGRVRLNIGINPDTFSWNLGRGETFQTPECVCVCSAAGSGGMSRIFHDVIREHILPPNWARAPPPPIMINSWEAQYFDVSHDSIVQMAVDAKRLGIEMVVLDDGWFGERHSDTTSLGDWTPNTTKFPLGIRGVAHELDSMGMKMGLWFEPEMVSAKSELYKKHPDWCLHVPGRARQTGRNQLVLDMGRQDVCDYLYDAISNILSTAKISYVKWDMNRYLTEVFSARVSSRDQGRVAHRFVTGTYSLLRRIFTESFPDVLLESCSGGGGRFDMGMLFFSPQVWTSDNTDARCRLKIQHGTSLAYPAQCMGSHYSVVPNHITMSMSRSRSRALVAMCGTFGYELDLGETFAGVQDDEEGGGVSASVGGVTRGGVLGGGGGGGSSSGSSSSGSCGSHGGGGGGGSHVGSRADSDRVKERQKIRDHIRVFKEIQHIVREGDLYRIWSPFENREGNAAEFSACAWMYVLKDRSEAVVFVFNMGTPHWSTLMPRIRLRGLMEEAVYSVSEPLPNSLTRMQGNLKVIETEDPVFLLGAQVRKMSGGAMMHMGLPIKFFSEDDAILFHVTTRNPISSSLSKGSGLNLERHGGDSGGPSRAPDSVHDLHDGNVEF
jgi:alpha-galactosidase